MTTLLVTGGAGFIGSNYIRHVLEARPEVRVLNLDLLTYAGNLENLSGLESHPRYRFLKGDIRDAIQLRQLIDEPVHEIVHFAAESHVDRSIENAKAFLETNILGTQVLIDFARERSVRRFVHVSTDEVYGSLGPADPAFTEAHSIEPNSPYAASKAASDLLVRAAIHTHHFPAVITRCSNNYGPYQFPEKLIPLMIANALEGKPLPVYGDGMNVRDWIHVRDHVRAVDLVRREGRLGEVYNVGGRSERPNLTVVKAIIAATGASESLLTFVKDRPGHDRRYAIDDAKISRELGFAPSVAFEEGIAETIAWYKTHRTWWERVRSGDYRAYYERMYGARIAGGQGGPAGQPEGSGKDAEPEPAQSGKGRKLSVLMPVYNEERTLEACIRRVFSARIPLELEIIAVDDGSRDRSLEILKRLAGEFSALKVHEHGKNRGKGAGIRTALAAATGEFAVIQDADLEYDPADWPTLLAPLLDGRADVVFGSRFLGGGGRVHLFFHSVANRILTTLSNLFTNLNLTDMETCYKAFSRPVIDRLKLTSDRFAVEPEITAKVARMGARIFEVPVTYNGRDYSEGKKIGLPDAFKAVFAIIRHSWFGKVERLPRRGH